MISRVRPRLWPDAGVKNTAEPDDEPDDAGGVHRGGNRGLSLHTVYMSAVLWIRIRYFFLDLDPK